MDIATLGLQVDSNGAVRAVDAFTASSTRMAVAGGAAESTANRLRGAFSRMAQLLGAGLLFRSVVNNTEEAQYAMAQLEAGVRSTGGAAGFSAQQLAGMASELQKVGEYSDEAIEGAQALLLTFTNIRGDVFRDATASVLDLAQRMGGDLKGASVQVGKALQDPIKGMLALRRSGVSFSASQQQVIKDLVNTGHVVEAQRMILKELETEFGGAAQAARNTLGGSLRGLKNDFGDLLEVSADGSAGIVGWINKLDSLLLFLKEHLDAVQKTLAYGVGFWITYTAVVKAQAAASAIAATVHATSAASITTETLAVRAATASIAGYETAAVSAGIASASMGTGATAAAVGVGRLALAGRGLVAVLTGPVGIALALTAVIALLMNYKSASDRAAEANARFADSLRGQTDDQLKSTQTQVRSEMEAAQRRVNELRAAGRDFETVRVGGMVTGEGPRIEGERVRRMTSDYAKATAELERLQAANAAVVRAQNERAATIPPPMVDVSTPPDQDKLRERLAQNAAMVKAAQDEVRLAGLQGQAQERLRIQLEATSKEMEARADLETRAVLPATLAAIRAERELKLEALDVEAFRVQRQAREDALRASQQAAAMAEVEGAAQTRLRIDYEALNRAIEARRDLTAGPVLDATLEDIATERTRSLMAERLKIVREYRDRVKEVARDLFEDIGNNGIAAIGNLFGRLRSMLLRFFAEVAAKRFMASVGNAWGEQLARLFGGTDKLKESAPQERAALALTGSAGALTGAAAALNAAAARMGAPPVPFSGPADWARDTSTAERYGGVAAQAANRPPALALPGVTATARRQTTDDGVREAARNFAKAFAKYIAPALAGFAAGSAIGASTSSRTAGTLGGAASGAATGALVGGPLGAAIGGLTGALGGFLGASKRRQEEERALRETLQHNGERIRELSDNIAGLSLMSGKNLAASVGLSKALAATKALAGTLGAILAGKIGGISAKDLGNALKGGESSKALQAYEKQFGVSLQDLGRMARQLGIELFDTAGKLIPDALKQLNEALMLTVKAATTFTASMDDQRLRQEAYNKLFDVPDTPQNQLNDAYERLAKGAPDLLKQMGLANLNLDSEAARKVLLTGMQDIFKLIDSGMLTPEMLGAFGDKEGLLRALLEAKDGLDAFRKTLGNVTTDFPKAMDLILYEQRYGHGTKETLTKGPGPTTVMPPMPPSPPTPPTAPPPFRPPLMPPSYGPVTVSMEVTVINEAGDDEFTLARKMEGATRRFEKRGGFAYTGATVPE